MEVFKKIVVFLGVLVGCCQSGMAVTDSIRPDNYLYQGQTSSYKEYGQYDYSGAQTCFYQKTARTAHGTSKSYDRRLSKAPSASESSVVIVYTPVKESQKKIKAQTAKPRSFVGKKSYNMKVVTSVSNQPKSKGSKKTTAKKRYAGRHYVSVKLVANTSPKKKTVSASKKKRPVKSTSQRQDRSLKKSITKNPNANKDAMVTKQKVLVYDTTTDDQYDIFVDADDHNAGIELRQRDGLRGYEVVGDLF